MHHEAEVMADAMVEILAEGRICRVLVLDIVPGDQPYLQQLLLHFLVDALHIVGEQQAGLQYLLAVVVHCQAGIVHFLLALGEFTAHRYGARKVGIVVAIFRAKVHQQQLRRSCTPGCSLRSAAYAPCRPMR